MKLHWKKITLGASFIILVILAILVKTPVVRNWLNNIGTSIPAVTLPLADKKSEESKPVRMIFVGDIMFDRGVESSVNKNYGGDFSKLFEKTPFIADADIAFANLEGPVTDQGNNVGSKYSFQMNPVVLPVLKNLGFDMVSFANNHVGDWNVAGFTDTLKRLNENNIMFAGAGNNKSEAQAVKIIEMHGMKIGFLAFSDVGPNWIAATDETPGLPAQAGILLASDQNRSQIIRDAKSQVDFLVVSYHWGDEYKPFNTRQKTLAESSIDAGADLIIGHHPHVIQDYAEYKNKLIFYSLGNFMFDQSFSPETMRGLIADITINPDGTYNNVNLQVSEQDKTHKIVEIREFDKNTDAVLKIPEKKIVCPKPKQSQVDKWLEPVSQDLAIGSYIPNNLIPIPKTIATRGVSIQCLTDNTVSALEKMYADARAEKLSLVVSSAFRSADIQQTLFANNQTANPNQTFPTVAKPEHSEHQLGTAIDFRSGTTEEFTLEAFGKSPEYIWMKDHAHEYGFVQSYPVGKESLTGYAAEPWHWRYVGVEHAKKVKESGLTLYEYLKNLK
jgi:poly-gamma-glutamate synthesis protein (capsule biosynthesis protein)